MSPREAREHRSTRRIQLSANHRPFTPGDGMRDAILLDAIGARDYLSEMDPEEEEDEE